MAAIYKRELVQCDAYTIHVILTAVNTGLFHSIWHHLIWYVTIKIFYRKYSIYIQGTCCHAIWGRIHVCVTKTIFHEEEFYFNFDWPQIHHVHVYSCKSKDFMDMLPRVEWKCIGMKTRGFRQWVFISVD
jgi:hypothetical protein